MASTKIALSQIARDPAVAAFLARGERDRGANPEPAVVPVRFPRLPFGAAAVGPRELEDA
ncbi:hypothetical protein [Mesorhizobium shangrilense]|uniref:Uncharacterized protein n=1 Tax=Mesorhizobium shangrilense TaxID=460060 RepID=A0ABV2DFR0_9HYPH